MFEPCPRCGNDDPDKIGLITEGGPFCRATQLSHEKHGTPEQLAYLTGSRCLRCGEEWPVPKPRQTRRYGHSFPMMKLTPETRGP